MGNATPIYISLGSNIDPEENTLQAISTLKSTLTHCLISRVYRSPAVGMQGADFINAVVGGCTDMSLHSVVQWLHEIENDHGRVRSDDKFVDRPLDLDLLIYGDHVDHTLPHHDIAEQAYVLQPLFEIAPSLVHPSLKLTVSELRSRLMMQSPVKFTALSPVTIDHSQ